MICRNSEVSPVVVLASAQLTVRFSDTRNPIDFLCLRNACPNSFFTEIDRYNVRIVHYVLRSAKMASKNGARRNRRSLQSRGHEKSQEKEFLDVKLGESGYALFLIAAGMKDLAPNGYWSTFLGFC